MSTREEVPSADVTVRRADGCLVVTLDRPEVRNALRTGTIRALEAAFDEAETDVDVRVVLLTGGADWFCAGVDLRDVGGDDVLTDPVAATARLRAIHRLCERVRAFPKPTVAAVEGYAIGIGFALALSCDLLVASRTAYFAHPAAAAGLIPDGGLVRQLQRDLGYRRTLELLLCHKRLPASDAHDYGLVSLLTEPGETLPGALRLVQPITGLAPELLFTAKALAVSAAAADGGFLTHETTALAMSKRADTSAEGRRQILAGRRFYD